jgi:hypothetical protein
MPRRSPGAELVIISGGRGVKRDRAGETLCRSIAEKLAKMHAEILAMKNPFTHLLPPDDPPPRGAPGQRIVHVYDELPEETEAAERQAIPKLASRGRH